MIILITGASHTEKTLLAQKMLEKIQISIFVHQSYENGPNPQRQYQQCPYGLSLADRPGMIKTAVENKQNLIVEEEQSWNY